jgi:hypothetical protein
MRSEVVAFLVVLRCVRVRLACCVHCTCRLSRRLHLYAMLLCVMCGLSPGMCPSRVVRSYFSLRFRSSRDAPTLAIMTPSAVGYKSTRALLGQLFDLRRQPHLLAWCRARVELRGRRVVVDDRRERVHAALLRRRRRDPRWAKRTRLER